MVFAGLIGLWLTLFFYEVEGKVFINDIPSGNIIIEILGVGNSKVETVTGKGGFFEAEVLFVPHRIVVKKAKTAITELPLKFSGKKIYVEVYLLDEKRDGYWGRRALVGDGILREINSPLISLPAKKDDSFGFITAFVSYGKQKTVSYTDMSVGIKSTSQMGDLHLEASIYKPISKNGNVTNAYRSSGVYLRWRMSNDTSVKASFKETNNLVLSSERKVAIEWISNSDSFLSDIGVSLKDYQDLRSIEFYKNFSKPLGEVDFNSTVYTKSLQDKYIVANYTKFYFLAGKWRLGAEIVPVTYNEESLSYLPISEMNLSVSCKGLYGECLSFIAQYLGDREIVDMGVAVKKFAESKFIEFLPFVSYILLDSQTVVRQIETRYKLLGFSPIGITIYANAIQGGDEIDLLLSKVKLFFFPWNTLLDISHKISSYLGQKYQLSSVSVGYVFKETLDMRIGMEQFAHKIGGTLKEDIRFISSLGVKF